MGCSVTITSYSHVQHSETDIERGVHVVPLTLGIPRVLPAVCTLLFSLCLPHMVGLRSYVIWMGHPNTIKFFISVFNPHLVKNPSVMLDHLLFDILKRLLQLSHICIIIYLIDVLFIVLWNFLKF